MAAGEKKKKEGDYVGEEMIRVRVWIGGWKLDYIWDDKLKSILESELLYHIVK